jgi:dynein light intermediate chain 1, cytosolic
MNCHSSKDGAGLFYTTPQPTTLQVLRQYTLHLLFVAPAPPPGISTGTEAPTPARNPFPFQHRTNTLDRDRIVVPAGWDSWGKIAVLRDGFDAKAWGDAWERDIDKDSSDTMGESGAKALYTSLVPDQGVKVCSMF